MDEFCNFAEAFAYANKETSANTFDKICAVLAFALGIVFILLGVIGLFTGCNADFTLPPIAGAIPAFVGWGIVKAVVVAWKAPKRPEFPPGAAPNHIGPTPPGQWQCGVKGRRALGAISASMCCTVG